MKGFKVTGYLNGLIIEKKNKYVLNEKKACENHGNLKIVYDIFLFFYLKVNILRK